MARVEIAVMGKNQTCKIPLVNGKTCVFALSGEFFLCAYTFRLGIFILEKILDLVSKH